jgi:hypothetical protein
MPVSIGKSDVEPNERIYLVHHVEGMPKQLSQCHVTSSTIKITRYAKNVEFGHNCDSEKGSSGGALFDDHGDLIGIHHAGFSLYKAQGLGSSRESSASGGQEPDAAIQKALFYNDAALKQLFEFAELRDYADPQLKSDVLVARSRICRYLQKYEEAWKNADAALEQVRHYSYAEPSGRANGLIARGEARLAAAGNANASGSTKAGREELLQQAQTDFERAAAIARDVPAIAAVTGLHLANVLAIRGNLPEAQRRFQQGWSHSKRIENGWVHQLASEVKQRVELPPSVFLLDVMSRFSTMVPS